MTLFSGRLLVHTEKGTYNCEPPIFLYITTFTPSVLHDADEEVGRAIGKYYSDKGREGVGSVMKRSGEETSYWKRLF